MVALSIAGLTILSARAMLEQLAGAGDRVIAETRESEREANISSWLRRLVAQIETGDGRTAHFLGDRHEVRFDSWCESPAGWQKRCEVTLTFDNRNEVDGADLLASLATGEVVTIRRRVQSGNFLYLYSAREAGTWLPSWMDVVSTPLALGIVLDGDTLILRIGERG